MTTIDPGIPQKAFTRLIRAVLVLGEALGNLHLEIEAIRSQADPAFLDQKVEQVQRLMAEFQQFMNDAVTELEEARGRDH